VSVHDPHAAFAELLDYSVVRYGFTDHADASLGDSIELWLSDERIAAGKSVAPEARQVKMKKEAIGSSLSSLSSP